VKNASRQQIRQLTIVITTNNHHRYTRDMQNIAKMCGEVRGYPKALETTLILSNGPKQGLQRPDLFPKS